MANSQTRIPVMDGLRGLAIILVAWFHIWQLSWLPNRVGPAGFQANLDALARTGFIGVDLFFLISGFCLAFPSARAALAGAGPRSLGHFLNRRALKILPSYWVSLAGVLLLLPPDWSNLRDICWHLGTHLAFCHNLFPDSFGSLNGVLWSLGVEIQFYLAFPLLIGPFVRRPALGWLLLNASAIAWRHWAPTSGLAPAGHLLHQLPAYLDAFANGMLAAVVLARTERTGPLPGWQSWLLGALGLASTVLVLKLANSLYLEAYAPDWPTHWMIANQQWLEAGFMGMAIGFSLAPEWLRRLVGNPGLAFLSGISYNLYLWHQPIARFLLAHQWPPFHGSDPHQDHTWQWTFTLVAWGSAILWSWLLTRLVEAPFLEGGWRPWRSASARAG